MSTSPEGKSAGSEVWRRIEEKLGEYGIDFEALAGAESRGEAIKVVCVAPDLRRSVDEMARAPRGQVVMVRVDEDTSRALDSWVETGAVKSRSEAAALFMREGLRLRASELAELEGALRDVQDARQKLRDRASRVLGGAKGAEPGGA